MSVGEGVAVGVRDARRRQVGIAVSAVLVLVAIFLATRVEDGEDVTFAAAAPAQIVDVAGLTALEGSLGHEIYWAGERPPEQLELSAEADGSAYLRYLPPGAEAGDPRPRFLTVGTYPVAGAVAALRRTAARVGVRLERVADGGAILVNPASPASAYLAYPGSDLQIEVYDPAPGRALRLIRAGAIRPAG